MGNQTKPASLTKKNPIQQQYLTKLFIKNKKSNKRFKEELASICKRSSYLQYKWAKGLLQQLNTHNFNHLYSQYQSVLKENCLREGQKEKVFCPANIQSEFIKQFADKLSRPDLEPSPLFLQEAFEQCKSYFMVMSWLHKMVTLSANDKENKGKLSCDWDQSQEEHIFSALLSLSSKTYRSCKPLQKIQMSGKCQHVNIGLSRLIKRMMVVNLSFLEKQEMIGKVQEQVEGDPNHIDENVIYLKSTIGLDQIFAYVTTIKEVGHIDITFLYQHLGELIH